jgi:type IV secretory pathway TrbL component
MALTLVARDMILGDGKDMNVVAGTRPSVSAKGMPERMAVSTDKLIGDGAVTAGDVKTEARSQAGLITASPALWKSSP